MPEGARIAILAPGIVRHSPLPRRWKRRGRFEDLSNLDDAGLLARAFGFEGRTLPAAPLHYLGITGRQPDGFCQFAYPVHLHPRREQLILMTGPEFELSEAEAQGLMASLQANFSEWRLERTADSMWFIITKDDPELETTALHEVLGENINDHLPRGGDAMQWHKLMNEIQMVLFDADVNRDREAAGRPPLNSLWIWGGGRLPELPAPRWRRLVSDDPMALGIGRTANLETHELPGRGQDARMPDVAITAGDTLWIHARAGAAGRPGTPLSGEQWRSLQSALRQREIEELVLIEPGHGELSVRSGRVSSWWPW